MNKIKISQPEILQEKNIEIHHDTYKRYKSKTYIDVTCNNCSTRKTVRLDQLSIGSFKCRTCIELSWVEKIKKVGKNFELIDKSNSEKLGIFCKDCNTSFRIQSGHVGAFKCPGCIDKKYIDALLKRDCKYIDRYTKKETGDTLYIVYENQLGEIREVQSGHLLSNKWKHFEPKSDGIYYLYLFSAYLEDEKLWYFKIGVSCNPDYRLRTLKPKINVEIEILEKFSSLKDCLHFETRIHKHMLKYAANQTSVYKITGKFKNRNGKVNLDGKTEWFSCENREIFRKELNNGIYVWNSSN